MWKGRDLQCFHGRRWWDFLAMAANILLDSRGYPSPYILGSSPLPGYWRTSGFHVVEGCCHQVSPGSGVRLMWEWPGFVSPSFTGLLVISRTQQGPCSEKRPRSTRARGKQSPDMNSTEATLSNSNLLNTSSWRPQMLPKRFTCITWL